ncbi:hypothetical protein Aperf_G00000055328 [Anoplocephala perfoliata]
MLLDLEDSRVKLLAASVGALSLYFAKNAFASYLGRKKLDEKRNAKIASLDLAKENFSKYLQSHKMDREVIDMITGLPLPKLIEKLRNQELSPSDALLAYQHKAFEVDKRLNCVTEFLYPELSEVNLKGPLAGVPVSLKECFGMKNCDSCCGCTRYVDEPHQQDAVALKIILDLGGIPFVRTNVSQTMLSTQCSNPINGATLNPLKPDRTSHGSSGGEAALIASGGSILGFGTDIGGSIRLPAAMCGIVGFKPTTGRLSYRDLSDIGILSPVAPTWGPLCRDVASCQFVMKLIFNSPLSRELDPYSPPAAYQKIPNDRRLRIGYFLRLDKLVPVPAVRRALLHARNKLASRGHELVEWTPPFEVDEIMNIYIKSIFSDGCAFVRDLLKNDKIDPCMQDIYAVSTMPWYYRSLFRLKMRWAGNFENILAINALRGFPTVLELEAHILKLRALRDRVMDSLHAASIDVVLCPVAGFAAALPVYPPFPYTGMLTFQNIINTLAVPAGSMPSGCVVEGRDMEVLRQAVKGEEIRDARDETEKKFYSGYGDISPLHRQMLLLQEGTEGLPIPIQFMSLPWQDELCLYAMRELESVKST